MYVLIRNEALLEEMDLKSLAEKQKEKSEVFARLSDALIPR